MFLAMRPQKKCAGISYIEAVVLVGVIGLLASIVTPYFVKMIDDSKKVRAQEDCKAIAEAIERFYQDLGCFPTMNAAGAINSVYSLVSGSSVTTTSPYGFPYGLLALAYSNLLDWLTGGDDNTARADTIDNHLVRNTPKGQSTNVYPTSSSKRYYWRGPYIAPVGLDPWGHPYIVTLVAPSAQRVDDDDGDSSYARWVISAGPNGYIECMWHPTSSTDTPRRNQMRGDDIGTRIDIEQ